MKRLRTRGELGVSATVIIAPKLIERNVKSADLLYEASNLWNGLSSFRKSIKRCREYTFGKQWGDIIENPDATSSKDKYITEEQHIINQGKAPLKNNMIRQFVKAVIGQFASVKTEPFVVASDRDEQTLGEMMSIMMKYTYNLNKLWDIDRRTFERFLISGIACHKITYGWNDALCKQDAFVKVVNPNNLFFDNTMEDLRYWDCSVIGEIYDLSIEDVISGFCDGDSNKSKWLRDIYRGITGDRISTVIEGLTSKKIDNTSALIASDINMCRVIEIWRKESKERIKCHDTMKGEYYKIDVEELPIIIEENERRNIQYKGAGYSQYDVPLIETQYFVDRYWVGRWLTPYGDILREIETPYWHKSHPYVLALYPFYDGEVHSFVEDIIDQQKYINRLITMIDFIMGASAKGVLLFPEDQMPSLMTMDEVADQWVKYNGIILYKPKVGVTPPQQISSNSTNIGAYELLNIQMSLMKDISGVHGAMQGQQAKSGTASSLYAQEAQNSSMNLVDVTSSFNTFREERDTKLMQVIQQYYTDKRYIGVAGKGYSEESKYFDPERVKNVQFDLTILESQTTATVRQMQNEMLLNMLKAQTIDIKTVLEVGDFPFAERMIQVLDKREKEIQEQQAIQQQQIEQAQLMQGAESQQIPQEQSAPQQQLTEIPEDIQRMINSKSSPLINKMIEK